MNEHSRNDGRTGPIESGLPPKVAFKDLNSKQKEIYNFQKVASLLGDHGFNCIKLADDWQGADFLAYHFDGATTLKVQLKGGLEISSKYVGKGLHLAYPLKGQWYIVEHDALLELLEEHSPYLTSKSWLDKGWYYTDGPNQNVIAALQPFRLG